MALNPSNNLDKDLKGFPTLGDPPFEEERKNIAVAELRAVGFPRGSETFTMCEKEVYIKDSEPYKLAKYGIYIPGVAKPEDVEWVWLYSVEAKLYGWKFYRAWYYWVCNVDWGNEYAIPTKIAKEFNERYGREVRVEGFAGGQEVKRPVTYYHIDTPRGLAAFMDLLKNRDEAIKQVHQKMREEYSTKARI